MATPSYTLRTFEPADYAQAYALWTVTEGMGLGASDTCEAIASFLERNPGLSLVACEGQTIIGTLLCGHDGRRGYLHHLAVARPQRRRGIANRLVNECTAKLAALRIEKCNLFLFANNTEGRAFWLRQGWTPRGDVEIIQKNLRPAATSRCSCNC
jgi:putative acetyltransferase